MLHHLPPILLAIDLVELIGSVVGLFALVLWVIKQIVEANKPVPPPRPRPAAVPAQAQPQVENPPAQQADPLRHQVEEFLRRSGRGPQDNQPAAPQRRMRPASASEVELLVDENASATDRQPLAQPLRTTERNRPTAPGAQGAAPQRVPRKSVPQRRQSVAEHVAENIAAHSREVAEQASRLGQRIIEDDQQFDVQLKAKFDHQVGTLTGSAVAAAEQAEAVALREARPAAQIAALLANPDGMRQAIVINEILRRPSERW
jgi:hypothetical protein